VTRTRAENSQEGYWTPSRPGFAAVPNDPVTAVRTTSVIGSKEQYKGNDQLIAK
jgi:hypothetical protein